MKGTAQNTPRFESYSYKYTEKKSVYGKSLVLENFSQFCILILAVKKPKIEKIINKILNI
jgi:hypothetical protein